MAEMRAQYPWKCVAVQSSLRPTRRVLVIRFGWRGLWTSYDESCARQRRGRVEVESGETADGRGSKKGAKEGRKEGGGNLILRSAQRG